MYFYNLLMLLKIQHNPWRLFCVIFDSLFSCVAFNICLLEGITLASLGILYGSLYLPALQPQNFLIFNHISNQHHYGQAFVSQVLIRKISNFYKVFVLSLSKMVFLNEEIVGKVYPLTILSNLLSSTSFIVAFFQNDSNDPVTTTMCLTLCCIPFSVLFLTSICLILATKSLYINSKRVLRCHQRVIQRPIEKLLPGIGVRLKLSTMVESLHNTRLYAFSMGSMGKLSSKTLLEFFLFYSALIMYLTQLYNWKAASKV